MFEAPIMADFAMTEADLLIPSAQLPLSSFRGLLEWALHRLRLVAPHTDPKALGAKRWAL
jgi:hypothetical protein